MAAKRILLVEGNDDQHVFKAIFSRHKLDHLDEIKENGGYDQLMESLPVRLKQSDVLALGVVGDADTNPANRWESIRHRLEQAG